MSLLFKAQLRELVEERGRYCVSIFMPTHRRGREVRQDPIRLKNLVAHAEAKLVEAGMRGPDAKELLKPAQDLLDMPGFWRRQSDGLALFLSEDSLHQFRLPLDFEPMVTVGESYHIRPLLPLLMRDARFYLLALSQNEVRLLEATQDSVEQVELEQVPDSLDEALRWDDPERQLQWHTRTGDVVGGVRAAIFHGHGVASSDDPKEHIRRFFRQVDAGLQQVVGGEQVPMVLAGVDYILDIYRGVNSYPHLIEEVIRGNPEGLSARQLHALSWRVVQPYFGLERNRAEAAFHEMMGSGSELASEKAEEIVPAAFQGRVEKLLVVSDGHLWGTFDESTGELQVQSERRFGDQDLVEFAVVNTLLQEGAVYLVESTEGPAVPPLRAILRY